MYTLNYCKPEEFDTLKTDKNILVEVRMFIGDVEFHDGMIIEGYEDIETEELIKDIDEKGNLLISRYSRAIAGRRDRFGVFK